MNRRDSIKSIALLSTSLVTLPAWAQGWQADMLSGKIFLTSSQQEILSAVADTIIPAGNSIGALSVGVDKFLERLFADCYETSAQDNIKNQLNNLEAQSLTTFGKSFASLDQIQRLELLNKLSDGVEEEKDFFGLVKSETIRGFTTSKEVMTDHLKFKLIPGHYHGCVDVNS